MLVQKIERQTTNQSFVRHGGLEEATGRQVVEQSESLRAGHVDDRARTASQKSRRVWDNPVLWREMKTWAYGRKILFINDGKHRYVEHGPQGAFATK